MKILLLNLGSAISSSGGVEKIFCDMGNMLIKNGHKVLGIIFENKEGTTFYNIDDEFEIINVGSNVSLKKPIILRLKRMFYQIMFQKEKKDLIEEEYFTNLKSKYINPVLKKIIQI